MKDLKMHIFIFNALKESQRVIKAAFNFDIFNPLAQTFWTNEAPFTFFRDMLRQVNPEILI